MNTNLSQHDKFIAYYRQLLPGECLSRLVNLGLLVMALLSSQDSHLSSLAEAMPLAATDLSLEQRLGRWLKNPAIDVWAQVLLWITGIDGFLQHAFATFLGQNVCE